MQRQQRLRQVRRVAVVLGTPGGAVVPLQLPLVVLLVEAVGEGGLVLSEEMLPTATATAIPTTTTTTTTLRLLPIIIINVALVVVVVEVAVLLLVLA